MPQYIQPEQALGHLQQIKLVDVRTPAEFAESHIPGAYNLPLFSDEERAEVGTLYKQVDPRTALLRGLELVGPKMRSLVEQADELAPGRQIMVHCWRGGQRSSSLAWLLEQSGYEVQVIKGGYKAYRQLVQQQLSALQAKLLIVGGPTGAGKTDVLHELTRRGEQVIDLEGLANHKGSAFGALGESPQPSVAQFENLLYKKLCTLDLDRHIWLEDESRMIGHVCLPDGLWAQMRKATVYKLEVSLEARLDRLVSVYAEHDNADLAASFQRIRKRLGGLRIQQAGQALEKGNYREAAKLALSYYDKAYQHHSQEKGAGQQKIDFPIPSDDPAEIAEALIKHINKK